MRNNLFKKMTQNRLLAVLFCSLIITLFASMPVYAEDVWNFSYTGDVQRWVVPEDGTYKITVAGASGGGARETTVTPVSGSPNYTMLRYPSGTTLGNYKTTKKVSMPAYVQYSRGGAGALISGTYRFNKGTVLYIAVGEQGQIEKSDGTGGEATYNGGGSAGGPGAGSGGGATSIQLVYGTLDDKDESVRQSVRDNAIMIAGGGGAVWSQPIGWTNAPLRPPMELNNSFHYFEPNSARFITQTVDKNHLYQYFVPGYSTKGSDGTFIAAMLPELNESDLGYVRSQISGSDIGAHRLMTDAYTGGGGGGYYGGNDGAINDAFGSYGGCSYFGPDKTKANWQASTNGQNVDSTGGLAELGDGYAIIEKIADQVQTLTINLGGYISSKDGSHQIVLQGAKGDTVNISGLVYAEGYKLQDYTIDTQYNGGKLWGSLQGGFADGQSATYTFGWNDDEITLNVQQELNITTENDSDSTHGTFVKATVHLRPDSSGSVFTVEAKKKQEQDSLYRSLYDDSFLGDETLSKTFKFTGSYQTYTAPVSGTYRLSLWGGGGGNWVWDGGHVDGQKGGTGMVDVTLKKGQTIYIQVGGAGNNNINADIYGNNNPGGWNGGGRGGSRTLFANWVGDSGAGATQVQLTLQGSGQLKEYVNNKNDVVAVVGGGGGGSSAVYLAQHAPQAGRITQGLRGETSQQTYGDYYVKQYFVSGKSWITKINGTFGQGADGGQTYKNLKASPYENWGGAEPNPGAGGGYTGGYAFDSNGPGSDSISGGGTAYVQQLSNPKNIVINSITDSENLASTPGTNGKATITMIQSYIDGDQVTQNFYDEAAPNVPYNTLQGVNTDGIMYASWQRPIDNGSQYNLRVRRYAQYDQAYNEEIIQDLYVETGVAKYRYIIDTNSQTDQNYIKNKYNSSSVKGEVTTETVGNISDQYEGYYIHAAAIDYAGNIGPTATWRLPYHVTIKYHANASNVLGTMDPQIILLDSSVNILDSAFKRTQYSFINWNTKADGSGTTYNPDDVIYYETVDAISGDTLDLYAQWYPDYYIVKFNGEGSTSGYMKDQNIPVSVKTKLNKNQFVREFDVTFDPRGGTCDSQKMHSVQDFRCWDLDGTTYSDQEGVLDLVGPSEFVTLTSQWQDKYIILPDSYKEGYRLEGWYLDKNGTETRVGTAGDKFLVDNNYSLYAKYIKVEGFLAAAEDATAANNHGGVNLDWHFTGMRSTDVYKIYQTQADANSYQNVVNDPQKWNPVQVIDLTKKAEPIYVLNIIPAQEYNFGDPRTGDPRSDIRRTYTFPEYNWDGYPTGNTYTVNMAQFGALKVWMEGGTIDVLNTYETTYGPNGEWQTISNPLQYNVKYDAYGASPYTGQQIIRVIPVYLQDINKNPSQYLRYDESTKTWKIKVNMNALYDPNGREVELSEIFIGSRDQNGPSADCEQASQSLVTMIQKFLDTGGQIVAGHDTMGWERQVQTNALQSIRSRFKVWTGLDDPDKIPVYSAYGQTDVIVTKSGIITNFPYELKLGTHLTVPYCHTIRNSSYGTVWMEFNENNLQAPADDAHYPGRDRVQGNPLYYLTSNGNAAMIQTGHSMCESTPDERKIIANLLFYLKQTQGYTSTVDNSAQDFESPDAVDTQTQSVNIGLDGITQVSINRPADHGTWYTHVAQAFSNDDVSDEFSLSNNSLATQNFVSTEVTTGVQGYYAYIDASPTGNISYIDGIITQSQGNKFDESNVNINSINKLNTIYKQSINIDYIRNDIATNWGSSLEEVTVNQDSDIGKVTYLNVSVNDLRSYTDASEVWMHLIAYDAAGNIQSTQHIKIPLTRITYNANGGEGEDVYQPIKVNQDTTVRENMFTREGYRFVNWNTEKDGSGTTYLENNVYRFTDSITLYAQWQKLYILTVDPNDGKWTDSHDTEVDSQILNPGFDTEATNKEYDTPVQFFMGPTDKKDIDDAYGKTGYNFKGWVFDTEKPARPDKAVLRSNYLWYNGDDYSDYPSVSKTEITDIYFVTGLPQLDYTDTWDASEARDNSVTAAISGTQLYISSNGLPCIYANADQHSAFEQFESLKAIHNIEMLNTSEVQNMFRMFYNCQQLPSIDVSHFDTTSATDMAVVFGNCRQLTQLDLSAWDVSKVTTMQGMFVYCESLTDLNTTGWKTSSLTNLFQTFQGCTQLEQIDLEHFDTSRVTSIKQLFDNCMKLKDVGISTWDMSSCTDFSNAFDRCLELEKLDISNWDTAKVQSMSYMFSECNKLSSLDISSWNVRNLGYADNMFNKCESLENLDLSGWGTTSIKSANRMFNWCTNLKTLDIQNFDTQLASSLDDPFNECIRLEKITVGNSVGSELLSQLPTPSSEYIPGADGKWYSMSSKIGYKVGQIPGNVSDTYLAVGGAVQECTLKPNDTWLDQSINRDDITEVKFVEGEPSGVVSDKAWDPTVEQKMELLQVSADRLYIFAYWMATGLTLMQTVRICLEALRI